MSLLWLPGQPAPDEAPWPTLGPQVIEDIEEYLVYGPGDLLGEPYRLTPEQKALICCMYEVYPDDSEQAGRRRYKRVVLSLAKGLAKTELAALIAICELSPRSRVRTRLDRYGRPVFDGQGNPVGGPVTDPYIPMVAYTEEQTEELAYAAARAIIDHSAWADDFDSLLDRIQRRDGNGQMKALASSPNARDGARTTFQHFDETHRFVLPNLKRAHAVMLQNIPKRRLADAWTLETTTSYAPGERSIAEEAHEYARQVADGKRTDSGIFYFHREASDGYDLEDPEQRRRAVLEASGPSGGFRDIEAVVKQYDEPSTDKAYWERVWCNRAVQEARKAFNVARWRELSLPETVTPRWPAAPRAWTPPAKPRGAVTLTRPGSPVREGDLIVLAFDGSRFHDATSLSARHVATGYSWQLGLWERPQDATPDWEVPRDEVDGLVVDAFDRWDVWRLYADPPNWENDIARWAGRYGSERVIEWWTNRRKQMAYAIRAYAGALDAGTICNSGDERIARHLGNAHRVKTHMVDEETGEPLFLIAKERPDSPFKMDAAMTEVLSNEARDDAIRAGVLKAPRRPQVFF